MLKKPWFGLLCLGAFALGTRFWQIDGLSDVVFDEVYYPTFAQNYLRGEPLFDAHPPLTKYLIALGIQILGYHPLGYRWISALAGALTPIIVYGLVRAVGGKHNWAWLAGWFTALDGLLLVESRYGLINIYVVFFGLCTHLTTAWAVRAESWRQRWLWTVAAGIFLGATVSAKWTGLGYGIALIGLLSLLWGRFRKLPSIPQLLIGGVILPVLVYGLQWWPHLQINTPHSILEIHQQIFNFHQNLGADTSEPVHPYCSTWWSWPLLLRPVVYLYHEAKPPAFRMHFVAGMGNPFLYWFGFTAIVMTAGLLVGQIWRSSTKAIGSMIKPMLQAAPNSEIAAYPDQPKSQPISWVGFYLIFSYAANWLPWSLSRRCIFLYHYMPASVFAFIALALVVQTCAHYAKYQQDKLAKIISYGIPAVVSLSFLLWLPVYIGLPISPIHWRMLMWLPSWI
ncbi:MAG: phospholipid carrier-dependent glycosyltransferase [Pseudanabaena sp. ELA607]|jgi:dolichyl-phosphate-mannose--protein O-mannosyl transferase